MSGTIKLSSPAREFWEIPVLYEDEQLLALEKPPRLLTSPDRLDAQRPSVAHLLHEGLKAGKPWARERNLTYLAVAHRLDFEASGALLLCKSKAALMALADQFGSDKPARHYVALAQGTPQEATFTVAEKIAPHPAISGMVRVDSRSGKKSRTEFTLIEKFSRWSLLRCLPWVERPHQIRAHLEHAGFPLVGDDAYGGKNLWLSRLKRDFRLKPGREERPLISRPALHLEELHILHPLTQEPLVIKSQLAKDLRVALKYLREYATGSAMMGSGMPDATDQSFSD